ncbi:MAG TPA: STAS domain-containing protein [Steroidobacteraceae bacterium]|nr:STAS domain-containing protein [Steroidobacteraceae bacterium]
MAGMNSIASALQRRRADIQEKWSEQLAATITGSAKGRISAEELKQQSRDFFDVFNPAVQSGKLDDIYAPEWTEVRAFLDDLSRHRVLAGFSSNETATFIFSLKRPLFDALKEESASASDWAHYANDVWDATLLLDALGLHTVKTFQRAREEVINRQQQELLELSTPVVKLWDGILALPMIGTLDSARTQVVMESLLQKIVETESQIAIIDITGVPTVDTLVAQHLLKTVTALRLMGADCIISGIRPQIAQTIVHLGVDLQGVTTKASLADALALALKRSGISFTKH